MIVTCDGWDKFSEDAALPAGEHLVIISSIQEPLKPCSNGKFYLIVNIEEVTVNGNKGRTHSLFFEWDPHLRGFAPNPPGKRGPPPKARWKNLLNACNVDANTVDTDDLLQKSFKIQLEEFNGRRYDRRFWQASPGDDYPLIVEYLKTYFPDA